MHNHLTLALSQFEPLSSFSGPSYSGSFPGLYLIASKSGGRFLVGFAKNIRKVESIFRTTLLAGTCHNKELQADMNAGKKFDFLVYATLDRKQANGLLAQLLAEYQPFGLLYNTFGRVHTGRARQVIQKKTVSAKKMRGGVQSMCQQAAPVKGSLLIERSTKRGRPYGPQRALQEFVQTLHH